ncbi:MAG TPA: WcaF family extracellular polysaccharide biosynthesis acetyltransferase [Candidatus Binataceae bacterium]|nr:WcaF family extracellular polysaccharide biosynthesis acetyltransferase [Candidatus Binataceae bacterium]
MRLDLFENPQFERGRSKAVEMLWLIVQALVVESWIPGATLRVQALRLFGARLGRGVVIKPHVRVKFPWKLEVGDYSWIGEGVWIDNLETVRIGANCCLSQGAYLCTGSHNWSSERFDLITRPITIDDQAWLGAKSSIGPGVHVGQGAVLTMGSVATSNLEPWWIHGGSPAKAQKQRLEKKSERERA